MNRTSAILGLMLMVSSPSYAGWFANTVYTSRLICRISQIEVHIVQQLSSEGYKVRKGSVRLDEGMGPMSSPLRQFRTIAHPADRHSSGVSVFKFKAFEREFTLRVAQNAQFQLTNASANTVAFGDEIPEPAVCESSPIGH